jgi:maltooligosyltrehalose trehalohydrolase
MAKQVSEGRRKEFAAFGWDPNAIPNPEDRRTFERSKLNWNEVATTEHAEMLEWHRQLIHLRKSTPDLNNGEPGNTRVVCDEQQSWLQVHRGNITITCNLADKEYSLPVPANSSILLASKPATKVEGEKLVLTANSIAVLRKPVME